MLPGIRSSRAAPGEWFARFTVRASGLRARPREGAGASGVYKMRVCGKAKVSRPRLPVVPSPESTEPELTSPCLSFLAQGYHPGSPSAPPLALQTARTSACGGCVRAVAAARIDGCCSCTRRTAGRQRAPGPADRPCLRDGSHFARDNGGMCGTCVACAMYGL